MYLKIMNFLIYVPYAFKTILLKRGPWHEKKTKKTLEIYFFDVAMNIQLKITGLLLPNFKKSSLNTS